MGESQKIDHPYSTSFSVALRRPSQLTTPTRARNNIPRIRVPQQIGLKREKLLFIKVFFTDSRKWLQFNELIYQIYALDGYASREALEIRRPYPSITITEWSPMFILRGEPMRETLSPRIE